MFGRKDLANIVRRRGYRVIKELLATSSRVDNNGLHGEFFILDIVLLVFWIPQFFFFFTDDHLLIKRRG